MGRIHHKTEISVVYKKSSRKNAKHFLKVYKDKTIDELLDSSFYGINKKYEIIAVGVGSSFQDTFKQKYSDIK